jgi:hypothetical protein
MAPLKIEKHSMARAAFIEGHAGLAHSLLLSATTLTPEISCRLLA